MPGRVGELRAGAWADILALDCSENDPVRFIDTITHGVCSCARCLGHRPGAARLEADPVGAWLVGERNVQPERRQGIVFAIQYVKEPGRTPARESSTSHAHGHQPAPRAGAAARAGDAAFRAALRARRSCASRRRDCIGAQAALSRVLEKLGKEVWIINPDPVQAQFDYLAKECRYRTYTGADLPTHDVVGVARFFARWAAAVRSRSRCARLPPRR